MRVCVQEIVVLEEEVKVGLQLKTLYLRFADDYIWVSAVLGTFCLDITEGSGYGKTAREDSQRALNIQVFLVGAGGGNGRWRNHGAGRG